MKTRLAFLFLVGVAVTTSLSAQTKASGACTCKPEPSTPVALTDKPNHSFAIGKATCTWTGFEIGGVKPKDGVSTDVDEITGDTGSFRGYHVMTYANGDTTSVRYQGTSKSKDGKPVSGTGTWAYTGGTGKLKGIKGQGTFKGAPNADGTMTYQVEGEYSLP